MNQRTVEVVIEDIDKNGVFLGRLYLLTDLDPTTANSTSATSVTNNATTSSTTAHTPWAALTTNNTTSNTNTNNKKRISYVSLLLSSGLAKIDKFATEKTTDSTSTTTTTTTLDSLKSLQEIQQVAKDNKLGIWSIEQPELEDIIGEGDEVIDMTADMNTDDHNNGK